MIYIEVDQLPSGFKPYPFKRFRLDAISLNQCMALGKNPTLLDIRNLIGELCHGTIDHTLLVPIDLKFLIAALAVNARNDRKWRFDITCPHCKTKFSKTMELKDFPPIPSLEADDPYPLIIDDGTNTYSLGYASVEDVMAMAEKGKTGEPIDALDTLVAHTISINDITDREGIRAHYGNLTDMDLPAVIGMAISKYFTTADTYSIQKCANEKCGKEFRIPMSAIEVTQYTPFLDKTRASAYKTNFKL